MKREYLLLLLSTIVIFSACRQDETVIYSIDEDTGGKTVKSDIVGMYLLNEGNMGSNKSTLDYLDLSAADSTIHYKRNIYSERNPNEVKELGDVGNDIQINGNQLWMVINCSNKVEVATVDSCKKIAKINIPNCRYVTFHDRYAYVSSYVGPVAISTNAQIGMVYKVDTTTFQKVDSVIVGYQPDELCIVDNKIYVANSGGYRVPNYDRTVSVIDLTTFKEERKIDVGINLHRCRTDKYGQVWVSSRGDYYSQPSKLFWLQKDESGKMQLGDSINVAVSDMCIVGDSLYFYGTEFSYVTFQNTITYGIINVKTHQVVTTQLTSAKEIGNIVMPYGIIVNPINKDFYIMDAEDYVSSGKLYHFQADGSYDWSVWTGDIPAHAVFVWKRR
jgi:hypothetical protein